MRMYDIKDVEDIVEEFLSSQFNFNHVSLSTDQLLKIKAISRNYGIEIKNIESQFGG